MRRASEAGNVVTVLKEWERRRRMFYPSDWPTVRRAFETSRQTVLYRLTVADVREATVRTDHSLGSLRKWQADLKENAIARDLTPAYPMLLLFHDLMERLGRVPLWQDVEKYLVADPELCLRYFTSAYGLPLPARVQGMWAHPRMAAVRYRIGNAYYSFLREVHVIATLREVYGLDARYHPILDAEWKCDIICHLVRVELFVKSEEFKKDKGGRKKNCIDLNPGLPVVRREMEVKSSYGRCWLFSDEAIEGLAVAVRSML